MKKKKIEKYKITVLNKQEKYDLLQKKAYQELKILEEYFGKRQIDQKKIYTDILIHLEAAQKELSYTGFRGVVLGLITAVYLYAFNTQIFPKLTQIKIPDEGNYFLNASIIIIFESIIFIFFIVLYFITTGSTFWEDKKRRKQIYINEYLIKLLELKIKDIDNTKTRKGTY